MQRNDPRSMHRFPQAGNELSLMYWWNQWLQFITGIQCVFECITHGKMEPGLKIVNPVIAVDFLTTTENRETLLSIPLNCVICLYFALP